MATLNVEHILRVHHWNDSLFSFATTRDPALRFENGQFVMLGLEVNGRPLLRAFSIASANHEEHLEFLSIKVQDGPLTSRLQHLQPGEPIFVSRKPTGSLLLHDLSPGKRLFMFSTGTGLAPFLSLVKDPEVYERFEQVVLVHGVRMTSELAYEHYLTQELPRHEFLGEAISAKLLYYPTVTREPFRNRGRLTDLIDNNKLFEDMGVPALDPASDRAMVCGSPSMLADIRRMLDERGFTISPNIGTPGDYVIERAFVEK
jgi:ferredoxin/flavodoxin---NADP+ reductase